MSQSSLMVPVVGALVRWVPEYAWIEKGGVTVRIALDKATDCWTVVPGKVGVIAFLKKPATPKTEFLRVSTIGRTGRYVEVLPVRSQESSVVLGIAKQLPSTDAAGTGSPA